MFQNLIKITSGTEENLENHSSEIIFPEVYGNFISVKKIKSQNIKPLLKDLEELNVKLEGLIIKLYRGNTQGNLVEQYENVLLKLKEKQDRLDYLSSFFETTRQKIEAVKLKIDEDETKLKEMEDKKFKIESTLTRIKNNLKLSKQKSNGQNRLIRDIHDISFSTSRNPCAIYSWNRNKDQIRDVKSENSNNQYREIDIKVEPSSNTIDSISESDDEDDFEEEEEEEYEDLTDDEVFE